MADEIKHSDLIQKDALPKIKRDTKKVREEFQALEKDIISLLGTSAQLAKAFKSPKDAKEIKALAKAISDIEKQDKALIATRKELIKVDKEIERERLAEIKLAKAREKAFDDFEKQEKKNAKTAEKLKKTTADNSNAYKILTKRVNIAQDRFKRLAAQHGKNSKQALGALRAFEKLDNELRQINNTARDGRRDVGRYGLAFQKVKGLLSSGLGALGITAGIAGIGRVVTNVIGVFTGFEKAISSLSSLTGATGKDLQFFRDRAREIGSVSTLSAVEVVEAFKIIGSQRPELLKNAEALAAVTDEVVILAEAAELDIPTAAKAVTTSLNQMSESADEAARFVNVLAAGSKEGAADIPFLNAAIEKSGAVARDANLSFEQLVAGIETIAPSVSEPSSAGLKFADVLLRLQKAGKGFESGQFDLKDALSQVKAEFEAIEDPVKLAQKESLLFGKTSIIVGKALLNNIDKFEDFTEAVTGTNVALEQQRINVDNLDGDVTSLGSAWEGLVLRFEDGEGSFSQSLRTFVQLAAELLRMASGTEKATDEMTQAELRIRSIANNVITLAKILAVLTTGFITYKVTLAAISLVTKVYTAITNALRIAKIALSRGITGATVAMKGFNKASRSNIIGLLVSLLATAVAAFIAFRDSAKAAAKAQREVNMAMRDNDKLTKSIEERLAILNELNKTQLQTLLSSIKESREKLELDKKLTEQLLLRSKQEAKLAESGDKALTRLEKLSLAESAGLLIAEEGLTNLTNRFKALESLNVTEEHFAFLQLQKIERDKLEIIATGKSINQIKEKIDILEEERKLVQARLDLLNKSSKEEKEGETDLIKIQLERLKAAKNSIATTTIQVAARNILIKSIQEQIKALRALGEAEKERGGIDSGVANQIDQELQATNLLVIDIARLDSERAFRKREIIAGEIEDETERDAAFLLIAQDKLDAEIRFLNQEANAKKRAMKDNAHFRRQIELQSAFESIQLSIETERQKQVALAQTNEEVIKINEKARRDQKAEREKFNNELELEQARFNNELTALDIELARQRQALLDQKVDNEKAANDKILADEKAANEKRKQDNLDLFNSIASATKVAVSDRNKENARLIDDEIKRAQDSVDRQREIAAKGQENILGEEQARLDKANLEKRREAKRAAKEEQNIALAIAFVNNLAARNKTDPKTAFALAARDTVLAKLFAEGLSSFYDGTEDTGTVSNPLDSKGGRKVIVHDNERVMTKKQNDRMGGISNNDAADIIYNHMHGLDLSPSHFKQLEVGKMMQPQGESMKPVIAQLKQQTDRLEAAFKKGQTQITTHWNEHGDAIETLYKSGVKKTTTFKRPRLG